MRPLHHPLGPLQPLMGLVEIATTFRQLQHAEVAGNDVGILAVLGFLQPQPIRLLRRLVETLTSQQAGPYQQQASDHRAMVEAFAQQRQGLFGELRGAPGLATHLQQQAVIGIEQSLENQAAIEPRQAQALIQRLLGLVQRMFGHMLLGQRLVTEHALRPAALVQHLQGLFAVHPGITAPALTRQYARQCLPMGDQFALAALIRLRHEMRQPLDAVGSFIETGTDDQGPGLQHDQSRRAGEQPGRQLFAPLQELCDRVPLQQLLLAEPLQVIDRDLDLPCQQGVFDGLANIAVLSEPLAGAHMDRGRRRRTRQKT